MQLCLYLPIIPPDAENSAWLIAKHRQIGFNMKSHRQGRQIDSGKWGEIRKFISPKESSIHLQPSEKFYTLIWSTQDAAVSAIRSVLATEIANGNPVAAELDLGKKNRIIQKHGWYEVWKKFSEARGDQVVLVRFDFPTRSISLSSVTPHYKAIGIAYRIKRENGRPLPADVAAMRQAFSATAESSIELELDWVLEALNP